MEMGALNLQGIEVTRKGGRNRKERNTRKGPTIRIPCEFARNGFIKEIKKTRKEQYLQGKEFARSGISKERGWNLQRIDFAR